MKKQLQTLCFALLLTIGLTAHARELVEMVVATTPGGSQDLATRQLQQILSDIDTTREYVVIYKPGAGGSIGYNYAIKNSTPTLAMISGGTFSELVINRPLSEIQQEVALVGPVWNSPGVLAVGADGGIKNLAELIKRSRERPVTCGAASRSIKLALDNFFQGVGAKDAQVILYKGTQEGMPGLISGNLDCWLDGLNGPMDSLNKSNKIKIIATSGNRPLEMFPKLPLMKRYLPAGSKFYYSWWLAVGVPESTHSDFKEKILPTLTRAIRLLESTDTVKVQQPDQVDPKFFSNWANFVKSLNE
jgi:tripartite-type tricarboxylate transporter receptor subunit TctC